MYEPKSTKMKESGLALALIVSTALLVGCSSTNVTMLSKTRFPPKPSDAEIELFSGKITGPYVAIAIIDSRSHSERTKENKIKQLEDLRRLARKLGADAVHNIRLLKKKGRGYIPDERVPIPAWKQGSFNLYFLRGEAIKYKEENEVQ